MSVCVCACACAGAGAGAGGCACVHVCYACMRVCVRVVCVWCACARVRACVRACMSYKTSHVDGFSIFIFQNKVPSLRWWLVGFETSKMDAHTNCETLKVIYPPKIFDDCSGLGIKWRLLLFIISWDFFSLIINLFLFSCWKFVIFYKCPYDYISFYTKSKLYYVMFTSCHTYEPL